MASLIYFVSFLANLATIQGIHAVEYKVTNLARNTPGGVRFDNEIGSEYSRETLSSATPYIWSLFDQDNIADRKNVQNVSLFIGDLDVDVAVAESNNISNKEISVSARYINRYSGDVKREFTGFRFQEMACLLQWNGNGELGGTADYVRLTAGWAPSNWVKFGAGYRWDEGNEITARFLEYCSNLKDGFVGDLNKKLKDDYHPNYINELLGKSVDEVWNDYKVKYGEKLLAYNGIQKISIRFRWLQATIGLSLYAALCTF